jgi:hypothetical protein
MNNHSVSTWRLAASISLSTSIAVGSCGNEPTVKVSLSSWPTGAAIVRLTASVNGVPSAELPPLSAQQTQFVVRVPVGTTGKLSLTATAVESASGTPCKVAHGTLDLDIPSGIRAYDEKTWTIAQLPSKLCTLSVSILSGMGGVTSTPAGISCSAASQTGCQAEFPVGQAVTLSANLDPKWIPTWQGSCVASSGKCQFSGLTSSQSVIVDFVQRACNASNWCAFSSPAGTTHLSAVWASSSSDAWIVGHKGTILRWDGSDWSQVSAPSIPGSTALMAVWGSSSSQVWFAGAANQTWKWNGSSWSSSALPASSFSDLLVGSLYGLGSDDLWGVAGSQTAPATSGTALRWNGSNWSALTGTPATIYLYGVWANPLNREVWVAGNQGTVFSIDGQTGKSTNRTSAILSSTNILSLSGYSSNDIWVAGGPPGGPGTIHRWDGTSWTAVSLTAYNPAVFTKIVSVGANDAWALTEGGQVFHITGTVSPRITVDVLTNKLPLVGMWANSPSDIWVVGQYGTIFRRLL